VNAFGVSGPSIFTSLAYANLCMRVLFQVFQAYYQDDLLKDTSPSSMYVISNIFFCHLGVNRCRLLVPG
jgi:hypothetical protein